MTHTSLEIHAFSIAIWLLQDLIICLLVGTIDNPIIYASEGFTRYTGYSKEEIEGRNCRFLQGKDSNPSDVAKIREAIQKKEPVSLCLLNYRKDGTTFLNQVILHFDFIQFLRCLQSSTFRWSSM